MRTPHVALLVETSREYGRGLLRGITRYHREHGPWSIYFKPHGLGEPPPRWLKKWRGDGILARINDARMAETVLDTGLPAVDLRGALGDLGLPILGVDNRAVTRLAMRHFLDRGFCHYGFCGTPRGENRYQDERCDFFTQAVEQHGFACQVYAYAERRRAVNWEEEQGHIGAWLTRLPKPVGIMTCHDDKGQQVLDACQRSDLSVPDEVAILGVDNDEFLCSLSMPPLSSVDVNPARIGYEAAAILDRLMGGGPPPAGPLYLEPKGIVSRQSTDAMAIDDPYVVQAIRLIREGACRGMSVEDVMRRVPLSRSALCRRFTRQLGRSPKAEITRVRLEKARELLVDTSLSVSAVSSRVGYGEAKYLIEVFRETYGITPLQYRRKTRVAERP
jgi:LacI family transcriptional regulator